MKIIHKIDDFLYSIFPEIEGQNHEQLVKKIEEFYTLGHYIPKVTLHDDWVTVEIDTSSVIEQENDYKRVVSLCEKGMFSEAKPILTGLIDKNPTVSDYHRIMGQILSEEGNQDEGINCLIDALRWDPKNGWALLMMGNIFAKHKDDIDTAMKYYDQALKVNPNDNISVNNIGANLMQQGRTDEAKKYFRKALEIDDSYPNTQYAMAMVSEIEGDLNQSFDFALKAIKNADKNSQIFNHSMNLVAQVARKISQSGKGKKIYSDYKLHLEKEGVTPIQISKDSTIETAAKMEFAENYSRDYHLVKCKMDKPGFEHLIMHELVHLDFVIQARKEKVNQLFISTQHHKSVFINNYKNFVHKLEKKGKYKVNTEGYLDLLFNGLNSQIFNAPIDLFIEDVLFTKFPTLRPFQFISLLALMQDNIKAVTDESTLNVSPPDIVSKVRIYNMVSAMQFRDLFGPDFLDVYNATKVETNEAKQLYEEFLEYREDKEPGEEYELLLNWANDLNLTDYFELKMEDDFRNSEFDADSILSSIENDPFDIEHEDPHKKREMEKFLKSQESMGLNMAMTMFMLDALRYFEGMSEEEIKKIALEIAMQGTQGFSPDKKGYTIGSIPGKSFSGYHILAYYYVSWALVIPEMLKELNLPYDDEYKMALKLHEEKEK